MKKSIVALTFSSFNDSHRRDVISRHKNAKIIFNGFKRIAYIYHVLVDKKYRIWTEDMNGNILFDTKNNDHISEVWKVRKTPIENLPLLLPKLKTYEGFQELTKRLSK